MDLDTALAKLFGQITIPLITSSGRDIKNNKLCSISFKEEPSHVNCEIDDIAASYFSIKYNIPLISFDGKLIDSILEPHVPDFNLLITHMCSDIQKCTPGVIQTCNVTWEKNYFINIKNLSIRFRKFMQLYNINDWKKNSNLLYNNKLLEDNKKFVQDILK